MASLQILKSSTFPPLPISQSKISRKSTCLFSEFDSRKRIRNSAFFTRRRLRVCCGVQEGDNQSNGKSFFICFNTLFGCRENWQLEKKGKLAFDTCNLRSFALFTFIMWLLLAWQDMQSCKLKFFRKKSVAKIIKKKNGKFEINKEKCKSKEWQFGNHYSVHISNV